MNIMNEISRNDDVGYDIMNVSNDKIIPISDIDYEDNQKLVIFDNYVCESFYKTPRDIRLNCSHYCIYEFPSSRERNMISSKLGVDKEKFKKGTKEPYSFLYVDKPKKKIIKKNFYGAL